MSTQGRVTPYKIRGQPVGPPRVWLQDDECPGLCMTRSFGDTIGASVGVISVPEVVTYQLQREDRCAWVSSSISPTPIAAS